MTGVTPTQGIKNDDARIKTWVVCELAAKVDTRVLRWIIQMERMEEGRLVKRAVMPK